jgi:tetratricopeptide (TPR) repeat protein
MKVRLSRRQILMFAVLMACTVSLVQAQPNNSISGFVLAGQRQPIGQINVELLDEFGRLVAHVLTDNSGRYNFFRLASGKYQIRVIGSQFGYDTQVQEAEIVNFLRSSPTGSSRLSGSENVQLNFYLSQRKPAVENKTASVVFVQEVPEEALKYYKRALSDLRQQRDEDGVKGLEEAIKIFPTFYYALERLSQEYLKREQFDKAEVITRNALSVNPRAHQMWYVLGYILYSVKKTSEAIDATNKGVEINPASIEARLLLGVLFRQNNQFKDSEKQLIKAKELSKSPVADVHWQLALLYNYNLREYDLAANELELFLKASPGRSDEEILRKLIKQLREKARQQKAGAVKPA